MARQLALDLGLAVERPTTVVTRSNAAAYEAVVDRQRWPHPVMLVLGARGSGKSHLAGVFADSADALMVAGQDLCEARVADALGRCVAVDDAQMADERALFHLINVVRGSGGALLLTAQERPATQLPDLASRLRAAAAVRIDPPDDALLRLVMLKAFQARQLHVNPAVVEFLLARMERTLNAVMAVVEEIDRLALAERRGLSRPLAARALALEDGSRSPTIVP